MLLDVSMPGGMGGRELTRLLRRRYGDAMVLIAVSGSDPDDERVSQTFEDVDHYFRKPVGPGSAAAAAERLTPLSRLRRLPQGTTPAAGPSPLTL